MTYWLYCHFCVLANSTIRYILGMDLFLEKLFIGLSFIRRVDQMDGVRIREKGKSVRDS